MSATLAAIAAFAAAWGTSPQAAPGAIASKPPPRVLLVTWDTTRADRVGCYGAKQARTPGFDELASKGVLYERAYAAAPCTLPSHTTILTGVYPVAHGVRDNSLFVVGPSARLLSESFREAGWRTGAFVGTFILDPKFGLDQGFEVYDAPDPSAIGTVVGVIDRPATMVAEQALRFVDTLEPAQSFFLWVHFYDPHYPHEVAPQFRKEGEEPYDSEIALCDLQLRRIRERLRERGLDAGLLTIVTADHGESFEEHGEKTHANFVYDATMHVPLVVEPPPPGVAPGTRIRVPVSTVDVAATLLERTGIGRAALPDARTPALPGDDAAATVDEGERALLLESMTPYYAHRWHPLRAVVWKGFKYIEAPRPELYDLGADPGETKDLASERTDLRDAMSRRLLALFAENPSLGWGAENRLTSDDQGKLAALGYAVAALGGDPFDPKLPDVKDRIGDVNLFDEADSLLAKANEALGYKRTLRTGRMPPITPEQKAQGEQLLEEARVRVRKLQAGYAGDPNVDHVLAAVELAARNFAAAIEPLEKATVSFPRNLELRYNLAVAYGMTGKPEWAQREMEKSIWIEGRALASLRWMVQFHVSRRDWAAAAWWFDELEKCPGQTEGDLANLKRDKARVRRELDAAGLSPRPPVPVTEAELLPEGMRARGDGR
jgi:arylsulfatase A-like enzyme